MFTLNCVGLSPLSTHLETKTGRPSILSRSSFNACSTDSYRKKYEEKYREA